jgi:hypothetical protein
MRNDGLKIERRCPLHSNSFSILAGLIFAIIALAQIIRACSGWLLSLNGLDVPVSARYIAFVVFAGLAWLGFVAAQR